MRTVAVSKSDNFWHRKSLKVFIISAEANGIVFVAQWEWAKKEKSIKEPIGGTLNSSLYIAGNAGTMFHRKIVANEPEHRNPS